MPHRFYSMSAQTAKERRLYYNALEITQKGSLNITDWMLWFLDAMDHAIISAQGTINRTLCVLTVGRDFFQNLTVSSSILTRK